MPQGYSPQRHSSLPVSRIALQPLWQTKEVNFVLDPGRPRKTTLNHQQLPWSHLVKLVGELDMTEERKLDDEYKDQGGDGDAPELLLFGCS